MAIKHFLKIIINRSRREIHFPSLWVYFGLNSGGVTLRSVAVHKLKLRLVGAQIHAMECQSPQTVFLGLRPDFRQRCTVLVKNLPYRIPLCAKLEPDRKCLQIMFAVRQ
jgi:hypothetical protein